LGAGGEIKRGLTAEQVGKAQKGETAPHSRGGKHRPGGPVDGPLPLLGSAGVRGAKPGSFYGPRGFYDRQLLFAPGIWPANRSGGGRTGPKKKTGTRRFFPRGLPCSRQKATNHPGICSPGQGLAHYSQGGRAGGTGFAGGGAVGHGGAVFQRGRLLSRGWQPRGGNFWPVFLPGPGELIKPGNRFPAGTVVSPQGSGKKNGRTGWVGGLQFQTRLSPRGRPCLSSWSKGAGTHSEIKPEIRDWNLAGGTGLTVKGGGTFFGGPLAFRHPRRTGVSPTWDPSARPEGVSRDTGQRAEVRFFTFFAPGGGERGFPRRMWAARFLIKKQGWVSKNR